MKISKYMTTKLITATPEMTVKDAFLAMHTHRVRHLPVVEGGKLVGIVSSGDPDPLPYVPLLNPLGLGMVFAGLTALDQNEDAVFLGVGDATAGDVIFHVERACDLGRGSRVRAHGIECDAHGPAAVRRRRLR